MCFHFAIRFWRRWWWKSLKFWRDESLFIQCALKPTILSTSTFSAPFPFFCINFSKNFPRYTFVLWFCCTSTMTSAVARSFTTNTHHTHFFRTCSNFCKVHLCTKYIWAKFTCAKNTYVKNICAKNIHLCKLHLCNFLHSPLSCIKFLGTALQYCTVS